MSNRICGRCKSSVVVPWNDVKDFYKCMNCSAMGYAEKFPEKTVFHHITVSEELLASFLVFHNCIYRGRTKYHSAIVGGEFDSKEEAIAATIIRLKEVVK